MWRDKERIEFGQDLPDEIKDSVRASAAFLAVMSPNYWRSDWCAQERKIFLDRPEDQLRVGRRHRFLKLVRRPWRGNVQEGFQERLKEVRFFEEGVEYVPGTKEFQAKIREAAEGINGLLEAMRRSREAVFVSLLVGDTLQAGRDLQKEFLKQGYDARPEGPLDSGFRDETIEKEMLLPAILSVHLLGTSYDPFTEHVIDLAIRLEKRMVFWLTPGTGKAQDARQRKLIERIRLREKRTAEWELLENGNSRAVIDDILELLKRKTATAPAKSNGQAARVYLLCDPKTDVDGAREIQAQICNQEMMRVELPSISRLGAVKRTDHEKMLRECDGLLLFRKAAPTKWLLETCNDVLFAENKVERATPVRSKAFLVNDPALLAGKIAGVPIIPQTEEFRLSDLEPFLDPLRKRGAYAAD
jgi:TIR domain